MKILCVGDTVGRPGRLAVKSKLKQLKDQYQIDFVILNAENAAGGAGVTGKNIEELLKAGCDLITLGDHVWDQKEMVSYLQKAPQVLRPANFPVGTPGHGWVIQKISSGAKVAIINLLGRVFMKYSLECPFRAADVIIEEIKNQVTFIIIDFHAEATSEKIALGHYLDGRVSAVFGTHTHVQTADEKILPKGTAYVTDVGMTGPCDSVIGQEKNAIISRFLTCMPKRFDVAKDDVQIQGVVIELDDQSGQAKKIFRIQELFKETGT